MKKIGFALVGIALFLSEVIVFSQNRIRTPIERIYNLNDSAYGNKVHAPDFGSLSFRGRMEGTFSLLIDTYNELGGHKLPGFIFNPGIHPKIASDKLSLDYKGESQKGRIKTTFSYLYEIRNGFYRLHPVFKIGFDTYFLLPDSVSQEKQNFNGIYRFNKEKWYDLVTGAKFSIADDLGKNRVLGFIHDRPLRLYGFNWNFGDDFYIDLPDFRLRQEIRKLTNDKFLFHNLRLSPGDFAVEIYDIAGRRLIECFDYVPHNMTFKSPQKAALAAQTVLTTNRRGHFYIAFIYPQNPYRIWKYNEKGEKVAVFGNYFEDPDIYEFPEEWITGTAADIKYYGLRRMYAINRLLTDVDGRLYVVFSLNRFERKGITEKFRKESVKQIFIDVYSPAGEFLGRTEFKYGIPDLIDGEIVYSRMEEDGFKMGITVVRMAIK
jgi:hypothetical protein